MLIVDWKLLVLALDTDILLHIMTVMQTQQQFSGVDTPTTDPSQQYGYRNRGEADQHKPLMPGFDNFNNNIDNNNLKSGPAAAAGQSQQCQQQVNEHQLQGQTQQPPMVMPMMSSIPVPQSQVTRTVTEADLSTGANRPQTMRIRLNQAFKFTYRVVGDCLNRMDYFDLQSTKCWRRVKKNVKKMRIQMLYTDEARERRKERLHVKVAQRRMWMSI